MEERNNYQELKQAKKIKKMKIKFLKQNIKALNMLLSFKGAKDDDKIEKFQENLEKLQANEKELIKLQKNKYNSSFYEFKPFIGLNRQQRRRL